MSKYVIARQWRGLTRAARAAEYEEHLKTETFSALRKIPGFLGASILRRTLDQRVEFLVVSRWESLKAIAQFAGSDLEAAVVPPKVQAMMLEYDRRVAHYEVVE
jgi:heme-degrading monooxygenase HmoA